MSARLKLASRTLVCLLAGLCPLRSQADWDIQEVVAPRDFLVASLAYTPAGQPAAAYGRDDDLTYSVWDGVSWRVETVDGCSVEGASAGFVPAPDASLAFDPAGHPVICYGHVQESESSLRLARWDGTSWEIQIVDRVAGSTAFGPFSLALDLAGHPVIAYNHPHPDIGLRLARWDGGSWNAETVLASPVLDFSLAMDAGGEPAIALGYEGSLELARWDGTRWTFEVVDSHAASLYPHPSLAFDPSGHPVIGYLANVDEFRLIAGDLELARWNGSSWELELVVDWPPQSVVMPRLILDASGSPHVAYVQSESVHLTSWNGVDWEGHVLGGGGAPSLALDSVGHPSLLYGSGNWILSYARWDGSTWQLEELDRAQRAGRSTSLALDSQGRPAMGYTTDPSAAGVRLARWSGTEWSSELIEAGYSDDVSLAFDESDSPILAWEMDGDIRFARWSGASWDSQTVDSGKGCDLVTDGAGDPAVGYFGADGVRLARWNGASWDLETVDNEGNEPSLAFSSAGAPAMAYGVGEGPGQTARELRFAHSSGSLWEIQTLEAGDPVCGWSLALDAADRPAISYVTPSGLKLARWDGAAWLIETLNAAVTWGHSHLAFDPAGEPLIVYRSRMLELARWDGTSWLFEEVSAAGDSVGASSLVLNPDGEPVVGYHDGCGGDLMLATRSDDDRPWLPVPDARTRLGRPAEPSERTEVSAGATPGLRE